MSNRDFSLILLMFVIILSFILAIVAIVAMTKENPRLAYETGKRSALFESEQTATSIKEKSNKLPMEIFTKLFRWFIRKFLNDV
jgi:competence protein ComGC